MRRILQANNTSIFSVIPSEIIEDLRLNPGDKLDFSIEGDHIKAIPVRANYQEGNVQADTPERLNRGMTHAKV